MDATDERVRNALRGEAATQPPARLRSSIIARLESVASRRSRSRLAVGSACVAVLTVSAVIAGVQSMSLGPEEAPTAFGSATASDDASPTYYSESQLELATSRLLDASRRQEVPKISYVRNAVDLSGLVVAVSEAELDRHTRKELVSIFSDVGGVPASIEIAELPQDGLPIQPDPENSGQ